MALTEPGPVRSLLAIAPVATIACPAQKIEGPISSEYSSGAVPALPPARPPRAISGPTNVSLARVSLSYAVGNDPHIHRQSKYPKE